MDRTSEFEFFANIQSVSKPLREAKFYEDLYAKLNDFSYKVSNSNAHKSILLLDKELGEFIKKTSVLLETIEVKGGTDILANFDGIKFIISNKMAKVLREVNVSKRKAANLAVDLEPEKPQIIKKVSSNLMYEQENRVILETTQYEATKQRLLKIEVVQRAIQENLLIQDERIDCIGNVNTASSSLYEALLGDDDLYNGSFFKRSASTILLCLTLVLLFLHVYYRK